MKESPVFSRTYDMLLYLIQLATRFPRTHRFGLGERITHQALDLQELLIGAGLQVSGRRVLLEQADIKLAQLRQSLRLGRDLGLLSMGQYEHLATMLVEIGRILGGWLKTVKMGQAEASAGGAGRLVEQ
jgi:hypothetical protein